MVESGVSMMFNFRLVLLKLNEPNSIAERPVSTISWCRDKYKDVRWRRQIAIQIVELFSPISKRLLFKTSTEFSFAGQSLNQPFHQQPQQQQLHIMVNLASSSGAPSQKSGVGAFHTQNLHPLSANASVTQPPHHRILVFGAQGTSGRFLVRLAVQAGHTARVFDNVADPNRQHPDFDARVLNDEHFETFRGDISSGADIGTAIEGCDAVVVMMANKPGGESGLPLQSMKNIIQACRTHQCSRLVHGFLLFKQLDVVGFVFSHFVAITKKGLPSECDGWVSECTRHGVYIFKPSLVLLNLLRPGPTKSSRTRRRTVNFSTIHQHHQR